MAETINQVQFPKVMICGPSGFVADVNSSGQLLTTGSGIKINGSVINNPNFTNSASATFGIVGSNITITASGSTPGGTTGQVQGNNSGVLGGLPGSIIDFTNGTLSIAPTGSGVAVTITGDSSGNDIIELFIFGGGSPVVSVDTNGTVLADVAHVTNLSVLSGTLNIGNAGIPSTLKDLNGSPGTSGQVLSSTVTGVQWVTPSSGSASSLKLIPIVLSGGTDAINPHTPATYVVTTVGVDAMTLAAPTVTTDDGVVIKVTTSTNAAHTITFTGGTLRPGTAAVTTANFASFRGSSIELMAWQGNWYVMAQNNIASYT
jgi:hypothetical protein